MRCPLILSNVNEGEPDSGDDGVAFSPVSELVNVHQAGHHYPAAAARHTTEDVFQRSRSLPIRRMVSAEDEAVCALRTMVIRAHTGKGVGFPLDAQLIFYPLEHSQKYEFGFYGPYIPTRPPKNFLRLRCSSRVAQVQRGEAQLLR